MDRGGVRVEEWVNAFEYELPAPLRRALLDSGGGRALALRRRASTLLKVSLQGRQVANDDRATAHLVFLVDISCSMSGADRLPLAKEAMTILTENLNPRDTVSIVTYAGGVNVVLEPTSAENKEAHSRRDRLAADRRRHRDGLGHGRSPTATPMPGARQGSTSRGCSCFTDGDANIGRHHAPADARVGEERREARRDAHHRRLRHGQLPRLDRWSSWPTRATASPSTSTRATRR